MIPYGVDDTNHPSELADAYAAAWSEWDDSGEAEVWNITLLDGLDGTDAAGE